MCSLKYAVLFHFWRLPAKIKEKYLIYTKWALPVLRHAYFEGNYLHVNHIKLFASSKDSGAESWLTSIAWNCSWAERTNYMAIWLESCHWEIQLISSSVFRLVHHLKQTSHPDSPTHSSAIRETIVAFSCMFIDSPLV